MSFIFLNSQKTLLYRFFYRVWLSHFVTLLVSGYFKVAFYGIISVSFQAPKTIEKVTNSDIDEYFAEIAFGRNMVVRQDNLLYCFSVHVEL